MAYAYVQDFEGYSDGELNGQDGWTVSYTGYYSIQGTCVEGSKAIGGPVSAGTTSRRAYKDWDGAARGFQTFYGMWDGDAGDGNAGCSIGWDMIYFQPGELKLASTTICSFISNKWYQIEYEWRSVPTMQNRARARNYTDDGAWSSWTAWVTPGGPPTDNPKKITLWGYQYDVAYWDYFHETGKTGPTPLYFK